jgi:glycosyltransferase involved in cell wall biosynthesis
VFVRELGEALGRRLPTVVLSSSQERDTRIRRVPGGRLISRELAREARALRPRLVVYVYPVTGMALLRARALKWCAGGAPTVLAALASHRLEAWARLAGRLLWPDRLLVTSEETRRDLASLGAPVERFSLGVDLQRFRPAQPGERRALRERWGLPVEGSVVLHVGHLVAARNLMAMTRLAAMPGVTPVVVASAVRESGSDRLRDDLKRHGVVVLDGYQVGVDELYRLADCYVFPSTAWGGGIEMPLSVLEALATDLPVVATPFGALPERFGGAAGVRFFNSDDELPRLVDDVLRARPHTRHLVESDSWDAVVTALLGVSGVASAPAPRAGAEAGAAQANPGVRAGR